MKSLLITTIATCNFATAATVIAPYANPGTDSVAFPYEAKVGFSVSDSWMTSTSVGGWSYVDLDPAKNQNRGWGHASSWFLLEITDSAMLTIQMDSANTNARPGFVLYSGESIEDLPGQVHRYSNNGNEMVTLNSAWDKNPTPLSYVTHGFNSSGSSVSNTFQISPGLYTLAVGNAADSRTNPGGQTYNLTFSTVPEPSAALLSILGSLSLLRRRR